jgi:hypothetical protein
VSCVLFSSDCRVSLQICDICVILIFKINSLKMIDSVSVLKWHCAADSGNILVKMARIMVETCRGNAR